MANFQPFIRNLGDQPGVQLNPPIDQSERASTSTGDQVVAAAGRFQRGAIDRHIVVDRDNIARKLGPAASIRASVENAAGIVIREALETGARECVVVRLCETPTKSFGVVSIPSGTATLTATVAAGAVTGVTVTNGGSNYKSGSWLSIVGGGGSGAKARIAVNESGAITGILAGSLVGGTGYTTAPAVLAPNDLYYSVSDSVPAAGTYLMYLDDANCWNSGVVLEVHADKTPVSGAAVANTELSLRIIDPSDGAVVVQVSGSLSSVAKDANGQSLYLPDVLQRVDPSYTLVCASGGSVPIWCENAYGRNVSGNDNWARSATLALFAEGPIGGYSQTTYSDAVDRLVSSDKSFGMLITAGLYNPALVTQLIQGGKELNLPVIIDVDGRLNVQGAIDYAAGLAIPNDFAHLFSAYWAPIEALDQYNGYQEVWGTSGQQAGMRAARNAAVNANGFAPKQNAIAGHKYPLQRARPRQLLSIKESELSDLSRAGINPVTYRSFDGGSYQFADSITIMRGTTSDRRAIVVGEMASTLENTLAAIAQRLVHSPMSKALDDMAYDANRLLASAQAAGWLVPSAKLGGKAFDVKVTPSQANPKSVMVVAFSASYEGTLRQVFITGTISG